jgi:hypothetical protein
MGNRIWAAILAVGLSLVKDEEDNINNDVYSSRNPIFWYKTIRSLQEQENNEV